MGDRVTVGAWWDIGFHLRRLWCFLVGHGDIYSVREFSPDPNSTEARELASMFVAAFGSPFVCGRCCTPVGDQQEQP